MPWQPALGTQPLAPFDHQVAGQSSMLRYDKTTVCKPLIGREHFVYKTLPQVLQEFTPEYRGEIEVQLIEQDGYIQLYGLSVGNEASDDVCSCSSVPENHHHESLDVRPKVISKEASIKNRSTARLLRSGSYEVSPLTDEVFYAADSNPDHPHTQSLNPWSLKNHKRLLDKMLKSEHSHNKIRFILLKNVVADFRHPCILDLKIGSRLHGDDASNVKVASQSKKCRQTTSSTLGVRLCGMQVYQVDSGAYHSVDKYHGRTLNSESFRDMLYDFLHNGSRFRSELIQPVVSRLSELIECLEDLHSFRFYASSLLIIYDGELESEEIEEDVNITPGNQDFSLGVGLSDGNLETKGDTGVSVGNKKIKVNVSSLTDDLEARNRALMSNITADLTPVEPTTEYPNFSIECCHPKSPPDEHLHFSKVLYEQVNNQPNNLIHTHTAVELCQSEDKHPGDYTHSLKEWYQSGERPQDEICGDVSSVSYPTSSQSLIFNESKQSEHKPESVSGALTSEVQTTRLTNINVQGKCSSDSGTIQCHLDALKAPVAETLLQKSDPAKNNVLDVEHNFIISAQSFKTDSDPAKNNVLDVEHNFLISAQSFKTDSASHWLKNHINQQEPHTDLSSLAHGKGYICPDYVPAQDSLHSESQAVHLDRQKDVQELNINTVTQSSSISSVNSTQTHPLLVSFKHSVTLKRNQDWLSDTSYSPITDEKTSATQDSLCFDHPDVANSSSHIAEPQETTAHVKQTSFHKGLISNLSSSDSCRKSVKVDVKMIDFAHTTHSGFTADKVKHIGPDTDYILGLKNLVKLFLELQKRE